MADQVPQLKKQLEFYESEVRRLEASITQQQLGYGKQISDLESQVKHLQSLAPSSQRLITEQNEEHNNDDTGGRPSTSELQARILELENRLYEQNKQTELKLKDKENSIIALQASINEWKIKTDPGDLSKLHTIGQQMQTVTTKLQGGFACVVPQPPYDDSMCFDVILESLPEESYSEFNQFTNNESLSDQIISKVPQGLAFNLTYGAAT